MPLFHGTTFFTAMCSSVGTSGCFCLGRKFSARNFWKDVTESRSTRILYVGELCRFLLATPPGEYDRKHGCIVAMGNGLPQDIWMAFKNRFGVPEVREFYRSTEGLAKWDNRHLGRGPGVGKVGFAGPLRRMLEADQVIVRFDYDSEKPFRDPVTGFCIPARVNEPGEVIARIKSSATYPEYLGNPAATNEKILTDVFVRGDQWQRSGDLLVQERSGWVRFVDRVGDTFRWKGENVSASEVAAYISALPHVQDVIVAGKQLSGYDGQAGVAAIALEPSTPPGGVESLMRDLCANLRRRGLPLYALPRFVALTNTLLEVSATFKHTKQGVKALDWAPTEPGPTEKADGTSTMPGVARKYFLDVDAQEYRPLDSANWARIKSGTAKL